MIAAVDDTPTGWVQTVFTNPKTGRLCVSSRELAAVTAHTHGNIMRYVRKVAAFPQMAGAVFWSEYRGRNGQINKCAYLSREALIGVVEFMHNVPGCRDIRGVRDAYVEMIDGREDLGAVTAARVEDLRAAGGLVDHCAPPAPDSEIRSPDPEPADTLEPLDRAKPASWEINYAINILQRSDQPEHLKRVNKVWNDKRLEALFAEAKSWTEAKELYATEKPKREKAR